MAECGLADTARPPMRKYLLPTLFLAFMLLNAALFVFVTREFDGSKAPVKRTLTEPELRRR